ncbi:MAG TPA: hypothetical protein VF048_13665, partial [Gemmatimonadaceae bacterium]
MPDGRAAATGGARRARVAGAVGALGALGALACLAALVTVGACNPARSDSAVVADSAARPAPGGLPLNGNQANAPDAVLPAGAAGGQKDGEWWLPGRDLAGSR